MRKEVNIDPKDLEFGNEKQIHRLKYVSKENSKDTYEVYVEMSTSGMVRVRADNEDEARMRGCEKGYDELKHTLDIDIQHIEKIKATNEDENKNQHKPNKNNMKLWGNN